ncbi:MULTISPECIES: pyruvate formate-lyase-activating protein [Pontibacillus]|uniref:Pyruvate formate-lyase-activating enzyme n=1 Tax=Pontibacillus chungwhensis TaxID=265426 RepID=A0ABY8UWP0_9BACI|nr:MULTISPECIES: pyruvate formate-lyase-activating protein [Pontibacillus]MCD5323458.1 pyruvate formate lyase-activating protein [Pontibacillus sp. HN14]WIF96835.1 pyruvate formate-lyase-activating protein [Pontibacillus chungwhensis]
MKGRIHSIETCGAVDGPGLRYVLFMQGCLLRCQFCHNADTWTLNGGIEKSVEEIVEEVKDFLPFFQASNGGVTVSGGEPLLQIDFLIELFKALKTIGVHTALDTSGGCFHSSPTFLKKLDELLINTDLVLLDLKQIHSDKHKTLTGMTNKHILKFATLLSDKNVPVWIRHVLVPTLNDNQEDLIALSHFIGTLQNVEKIEVLPYHKLGVYKWENLGIPYPLEGIESPSNEQVWEATQILKNPSPIRN